MGPGANYLAFTSTVMMILAVFATYLTALVIVQRVRQDGQLKYSQMMSTAIALFLSLLGFIGWRICTLIRAVTPELNTMFVTENLFPNRKDHVVRFANAAFVALTVCFFVVAYLGLSLSWIEIAQRVVKFTSSGEQSARRWTAVIVTLEVLVLLAGLIGYLLVGSTAFTLILGAPLLLFVSLSYMYGQYRLIPLLKGMVRGEDHRKITSQSSLVWRIRRTTRLLLVAMLGIFISGFFYAGLVYFPEGGWRGVSPDGQVSPVLVINEVLPAFALFGAFVLRWFLSRSIIISARTTRLETKTSTVISTVTRRSTFMKSNKTPSL